MEWINVEDRLPEEGMPVVVFGKGGEEIYSGFHARDFIEHYKDVTHWFPLPSPPEA